MISYFKSGSHDLLGTEGVKREEGGERGGRREECMVS